MLYAAVGSVAHLASPGFLVAGGLGGGGGGAVGQLQQQAAGGPAGAYTLAQPRTPIPAHRAALARHFRSDTLVSLADTENDVDTLVLRTDGTFASKASKLP